MRSTPERRRGRTLQQLKSDWYQTEREWIARRAYDLFLARGGKNGRDLDDWLQAERELTAVDVQPRR
jgi:Protein of unknown function (DUF2934)